MSIVNTSTQLPAGTWQSDPVHSTVEFAVKHMGVQTFRARFDSFNVVLAVDEDGAAELNGTVHSGSVVVKDPNLAAHLASPEFFDTDRHRDLSFRSTAIRAEDGRLEVDGDLTIKGRTLRVTGRGAYEGPYEDIGGDVRLGLSLETVVDRRQFGLEWNAPLPRGGWALSNDVTLRVDLSLRRA